MIDYRYIAFAALCLASQGAFGQAADFLSDRNFQRLDKPFTTAPHVHKALAAKPLTDLNYWQGGAQGMFPSWTGAYGLSVLYTNSPKGKSGNSPSGVGDQTFQSVTSWNHLVPSGGGIHESFSETASYQATGDYMGAVTPGISDTVINEGINVFAPFVSAGYPVATWLEVTPTITFVDLTVTTNNAEEDIRQGGGSSSTTTRSSYVPDLMVTSNTPVRHLIGYADGIAASHVSGPGAVQIGGKYAFNEFGTTSFKAAITVGAATRPGFLAQFLYRF